MTGALLAIGAMLVIGIVVLAAFRWRYSIVTVRGQSMEPALRDGDRVLVRRCGVGKLRTGQLVVFREPDPDGLRLRRLPASLTGANQENWIIKRVAAVPGEPVPQVASEAIGHTLVVPPRSIVVLGDAYASCDSRLWGLVPASNILGTGTRRPGAKMPGQVPGQVQPARQRAYPRGSQ
jgi:signal peptidase I